MTNEEIARRIEHAFATRDLAEFGELLAEDARWGDDNPRRCRSRQDIVGTFARGLGEGLDGSVVSATIGPGGVVCELEARWPDGLDRPRSERFYHSYLVREGKIAEIQRHDDEDSALEAIGS